MDINIIRGVLTVICLLIFCAIFIWAWSSTNKQRFDEAANLPFADDADLTPPTNENKGH